MGRDLEEGGNQFTFCSKEQTLQTAAGSTQVEEKLGSRRGQARDSSLNIPSPLPPFPPLPSPALHICLSVCLSASLSVSPFLS